jgi:Protein of unknown function (DUF1826)
VKREMSPNCDIRNRPSAQEKERPSAIAPRPMHLVTGNDRSVLTDALQPHINLAIWRREIPRAIALWLAEISCEELVRSRDIDKELSAECVPAVISSGLPARDPAAVTGVAALAHDVGGLAALLAQMSGNPVRLRLEWVRERQCRYFHADSVPIRLLCTYRGAGTEWIANDVAAKLTSAESIPPLTSINRLGTGDVAIMRGSRSDAPAGPVRHRSPSADAADAWRLLLAIDPVSGHARRRN